MADNTERATYEGLEGPALLNALLAEKDVQPIRSVEDLACDGFFDTDEELSEFLSWVDTARRINLA